MVTFSHLLRTQILVIKNPLSISSIIVLLFFIISTPSFAARVEVTGGGGGSVSDAAYGVTWNGDTTVAPSKNAVYDKIETIASGGDNITVNAAGATNANFLDNLYIDWALDTAATPDDVTGKFNYAETLAGNPALLATEIIFMADGLLAEGATADAIEFKLAFPDPVTTDKTITLPNATDTLVGKDTTDTLTNKTLAAANNVIDADTAVALAANGTNCSAGSYPLGVDASGASETCTTAASTAADFITGSAQATLSAEQSLGALTTGLLLNTVAASTGTVSAYAGTSCTNQFPRSLNASGTATCASVGAADITDGVIDGTELAANTKIISFGITIDGGGSAITTGVKGYIEIPFAMTITGWTALADVSGSIVVDIFKDTYANYPPVAADTIAGTEKPTITTATKNQDLTLTTWTTAVAAGDIIGFNVDSATTVTRVHIIIRGNKT